MSAPETNWERHAAWATGLITDREYAVALVVDGHPVDHPIIRVLLRRDHEKSLAELNAGSKR